ncbi:unnamed protein product [Malus baccata var. baccata]
MYFFLTFAFTRIGSALSINKEISGLPNYVSGGFGLGLEQPLHLVVVGTLAATRQFILLMVVLLLMFLRRLQWWLNKLRFLFKFNLKFAIEFSKNMDETPNPTRPPTPSKKPPILLYVMALSSLLGDNGGCMSLTHQRH